MRTLLRAGLAMLTGAIVLVAPAGAVEIEVTTTPELGEANLVRNPAIEDGADGEPAHWRFNTAIPDNFAVGWSESDGRDGSRALHVVAHDKVMSGYWAQTVPVTAGDYLFRGWYRTTGGRLLMYAHGTSDDVTPAVGVDARTYHGAAVASFLVPVFIPREALTGPDPDTYYPFSVEVEVPEGLEQLALSMGIYFTPGEAWFDDIWFGAAQLDLDIRVTGGGERIAKLKVFQDGVEEPVYSSEDDPDCPAEGPLPEPFEVTVSDVAADGSYLIAATTVEGELHRVRFPREAR
jgi:hypothetical protein